MHILSNLNKSNEWNVWWAIENCKFNQISIFINFIRYLIHPKQRKHIEGCDKNSPLSTKRQSKICVREDYMFPLGSTNKTKKESYWHSYVCD